MGLGAAEPDSYAIGRGFDSRLGRCVCAVHPAGGIATRAGMRWLAIVPSSLSPLRRHALCSPRCSAA
jgi:hypothetical protein